MSLKDKLSKPQEPQNEHPSRVRARCADSQNEVEILAPEKSKGGKQLETLLTNSRAREKAVAALEAALKATRTVYCPKSKELIEEPDHRVRAAAAVDLLCFTDGKPVERRENVNINIDGQDAKAVEDKMLSSPAMRAALKRKIEQVDKSEQNGGKS